MSLVTGVLELRVSENIRLTNGNIVSSTNTKSISGINQIVQRTDTISTKFEDTGVEILKFVNNENEQTAGSFVKDDVKYIRITNMDGTNKVTLYLIQTNEESVLFELEAGKTFMLGNAEFNASQTGDYVVETYVDETYYSSFTNFDTIKAKADTADVIIEYFVAST